MNLESRMVTEREMRRYVESHAIATRLAGIFNFIALLLCLLMDLLNAPSEIRIPVNRDRREILSGAPAVLRRPDSFALRD